MFIANSNTIKNIFEGGALAPPGSAPGLCIGVLLFYVDRYALIERSRSQITLIEQSCSFNYCG